MFLNEKDGNSFIIALHLSNRPIPCNMEPNGSKYSTYRTTLFNSRIQIKQQFVHMFSL